MIFDVDFCASKWGRFLFGNSTKIKSAGVKWDVETMVGYCKNLRGLVLIHGYNSDQESANLSYDIIITNLRRLGLYGGATSQYKFVWKVFWPGGWKPGYWVSEWRASGIFGLKGTSGRLEQLMNKCDGALFDVQAHSLGNLVALDANISGKLNIANMLLTNAAVDNESISAGQRFYHSVYFIRGMAYVVWSKNDEVLKFAYAASKLDRALGYTGPVGEICGHTVSVDATPWCDHHSSARDAEQYYETWREMVVMGELRK